MSPMAWEGEFSNRVVTRIVDYLALTHQLMREKEIIEVFITIITFS